MKAKITFFVCMLLMSDIVMGQKTTSSSNFLEQHQAYFALGDAIAQKLANDTLKLAYTLSLHASDNVVIDWYPTHQPERLYASLRFAKRFSICEFWCDAPMYKDEKNPYQQHKGMQKSMEMFAKHFLEKPPSKKSELWKQCQTQTIKDYLKQADQIAEKAYLCASGDDYQVSYYTEIHVNTSSITLAQSNWWNAKSLDRENYSMRKLTFLIPFKKVEESNFKTFKNDFLSTSLFHFKEMQIAFEDRSSPNYKACGEEVLKTIEALIKK